MHTKIAMTQLLTWTPYYAISVMSNVRQLKSLQWIAHHIYVAIVTFGALSPFVNNDNATLRQCRDAGIVVTGRDPFFGTGLCGPFLPVHAPADVYHVRIARTNVRVDHLRLLRHFPNLRQITATNLTIEQDRSIHESAPRNAWLSYDVVNNSGFVVRTGMKRVDAGRTSLAIANTALGDVNGDGIVNEDDNP